MSAPLSAVIEGDLTEVVIEEERFVVELWAGFGSGGGSGDATSIQGTPVSETDPVAGQALVSDGTDYVPTNIATQAELDAVATAATTHAARTDNPHAVTAAQVGAYTIAAVDSALAGKSDVGHTHTFASITSTPTTLAGYGILDAALDADLDAHTARTDNPHAVTKAQVGLSAVENTALSTWAGSANITTLGTITTGTVPAPRVSAGTFQSGDMQMTALILDQGTLDDRILSLRSTGDVAHGMTSEADTAAFASLLKVGATFGGLRVNAFTDVAMGADDATMQLWAFSHSDFNNTNTNQSTTRAVIEMYAYQHDGANALVDWTGTENLFALQKNVSGARRTVMAIAADGVLKLINGADITRLGNGLLFLNEDTNANMTMGLTARLPAGQTQSVCLKGAQVATGATTLPLSPYDIETDDYLLVGEIAAATGGLYMVGMAESTVAVAAHFEFWGGAPATTDTSSSLAACNFFVGQHDGANADADMAANSNAFAWGEIDSAGARQTRMLLKADDGELHLGNATLVALDTEDDVQAVRALQVVRTDGRGIVRNRFDRERPAYDYGALHALGVVGERDAAGEFLIRVQPYLNLHDGAIWQLHTRVSALEEGIRHLLANPDDRGGALRLLEA